MMTKSDLRHYYLKQRLALRPKEIIEKSRKIAGQIFEENQIINKNTFHIFLPIAHNNEIYTWPIIEQLWSMNKQVVAPITNFRSMEMTNFLITPDTELVENHLGIPEPHGAVKINDKEIDVVFVPLLIFDKNGHRIGYGKGFYDRFLQRLNENVIKVGLSFFPPVECIEDTSEWDELLNYCALPDLMISF